MIFAICMAAIGFTIYGWSCWETLKKEYKAREEEDTMRLISKWNRISEMGKSEEKPKEFETKTT